MPRPLDEDTIAALATAPGRGGVGIIRISGKQSLSIGETIGGKQLRPRLATFSPFKNESGVVIDSGIALFFPAPHSFTGEDIVELQCHGSPVVLDQLLHAVLALGARMARAGEFSERAFLNNKIDLSQAEAIADLIMANTVTAAHSALATLQGAFSKEVNKLIDLLTNLRVYIEAAMDFPDEEIDFLGSGKIMERLDLLEKQLQTIHREAHQGVLINEGITLVIAGKPNAGKSSLLNALAGRDSAIVTEIPGTTRDLLREHIEIDGIPLHIIDTAGLRASEDPVEQEGIRRALVEMQKADRILLMVDSTDPNDVFLTDENALDNIWPNNLPFPKNKIPITIIKNKCDISNIVPVKTPSSVVLSAKTGAGLDLLKTHLKETMGYHDASAGKFSARRRHLDGLEKAAEHIRVGRQQLLRQKGGELLAEELRLAQQKLEVITGRFTPDDLLDKIFRDFCIGK